MAEQIQFRTLAPAQRFQLPPEPNHYMKPIATAQRARRAEWIRLNRLSFDEAQMVPASFDPRD